MATVGADWGSFTDEPPPFYAHIEEEHRTTEQLMDPSQRDSIVTRLLAVDATQRIEIVARLLGGATEERMGFISAVLAPVQDNPEALRRALFEFLQQPLHHNVSADLFSPPNNAPADPPLYEDLPNRAPVDPPPYVQIWLQWLGIKAAFLVSKIQGIALPILGIAVGIAIGVVGGILLGGPLLGVLLGILGTAFALLITMILSTLITLLCTALAKWCGASEDQLNTMWRSFSNPAYIVEHLFPRLRA